MLYLDTHAVAWLHGGRADRLSERGRALVESEPLVISPMVRLELDLLHQLGRVRHSSVRVIGSLTRHLRLGICDLPFDQVVEAALHQSWTRDPFDRLIVAHAALARSPLLTRDGAIRQHYPQAVW